MIVTLTSCTPDTPLVSVVIVTYNSKRFIQQCLETVIRSSYSNTEIIVVDNHSEDGTADYIHLNYPSVKLIQSQSNLRFVGGNNLGMKYTKGDFIFLLNPDAYVDTNCIRELVDTAEDDSIGIVGCKIYNPDSSLQHTGGILYPTGSMKDLGGGQSDHGQFDKKKDVTWVSGAALMISKHALSMIGPLDPIYYFYYDDIDWCWRAHKAGFKVMYVPLAIVHHFG